MSDTTSLPHALELSKAEWTSQLNNAGFPKFRSQQLTEWIYEKKITSLEQARNLPKNLRESLEQGYSWEFPQVVSRMDSEDGASKLLLRSKNVAQVYEAVILRYENRTSLCVSSQVGCKLACTFCQTGKLGFFRNLSTAEIIGQYRLAENIVKDEGRRISHIVFMGMGEPLDNYTNVAKAVNLLTSPDEYKLSARKVTVSTSGIVPKILRLAEEARCSLAVSLHAPNDKLRSSLMPINKRYDLTQLKESLKIFQAKTGQTITIEYILLENQNDSLVEAKQLVKYLHGLKAKINLIPFNTHPGSDFLRPQIERMEVFQKHLSSRGYPAPIRYSKGLGVSAACGQLAAKSQQNISATPARKNVVTHN